MRNCDPTGTVYRHPAMLDVDMLVMRKFYIKEKDMWSLKIWWMIRDKTLASGYVRKGGMMAAPYRIKITASKFKEFKRI